VEYGDPDRTGNNDIEFDPENIRADAVIREQQQVHKTC